MSVPRAFFYSHLYASETAHSSHMRNGVPTCTPRAPRQWAAWTPRRPAIPPAAITGTETADSPLTSRKDPRRPPASLPCRTLISIPRSSSRTASCGVVAVTMREQPFSLILACFHSFRHNSLLFPHDFDIACPSARAVKFAEINALPRSKNEQAVFNNDML